MSKKSNKLALYRIVEDMGDYFIEESRTTIFGGVKWARWQQHSMVEIGYCYDLSFQTEGEARAYLAQMLAAWKRNDKLKRRGPRIVIEVME
jgi:hypothetical protein